MRSLSFSHPSVYGEHTKSIESLLHLKILYTLVLHDSFCELFVAFEKLSVVLLNCYSAEVIWLQVLLPHVEAAQGERNPGRGGRSTGEKWLWMIKGCLLPLFVWTQRDLDIAIYGPIVAKIVLVHYKKLGRISTILTKTIAIGIWFRYWGKTVSNVSY